MKLRIIFPSVVLAILIILVIIALGYPDKARLFPLLIMVPVVALLVAQILREARAKVKQETAPGISKTASEVNLTKYLRAQAWVAVLLLLIYLLGFIVGTPLFALIYLKLRGVKWLPVIICVLAVIAVVYGAFGKAFEVYLYKGLLFS